MFGTDTKSLVLTNSGFILPTTDTKTCPYILRIQLLSTSVKSSILLFDSYCFPLERRPPWTSVPGKKGAGSRDGLAKGAARSVCGFDLLKATQRRHGLAPRSATHTGGPEKKERTKEHIHTDPAGRRAESQCLTELDPGGAAPPTKRQTPCDHRDLREGLFGSGLNAAPKELKSRTPGLWD